MIVTCDFETMWSQDYSLTKMSETEYILDDRFEPIMCGIKVGDGATKTVVGDKIAPALASIDWSTSAMLAHNCMPGDTEVLTHTGWVRLDVLADGTHAAQFDNGVIEFVPAKIVRKPYAGPMLVWDTLFHQGAYTPDHRVYYSTPDRTDWRVASASAIAGMSQNNTYLPVSGTRRWYETIELSTDEARLLEAVRADATVTPHSVKFNLKKKRKIARLMRLCAAVGAEVTVAPEGRPDVVSCYVRQCPARERVLALLLDNGRKQLSWRLLDASVETRQAYLDELRYWDGHWSDASIKLATACQQDRDVIQAVAVCTGCRSRFTTSRNDRGFGANNIDAVIHTGSIKPTRRTKLVEPPQEVLFNGTVYCLTVPSGAFVVRRNSVVWVTGNCRFDGAILAWRYGHVPAMYLDTLSMSRATTHWTIGRSTLGKVAEYLELPPKGDEVVKAKGKRLADFTGYELDRYREYCARDTDLCYEIFQKMRPMFAASELHLIDLIARMFIQPQVRLNAGLLRQNYQRVLADKAAALKAVAEIPPDTFSSQTKFAALLEEHGVQVPTKISPATGQSIPALAKGDWEFKELCADDTQPMFVQALLSARLAVKSTLEETRSAAMLRLAEKKWRVGTGWAPVPLKYYGARTGRLSGDGGSNWQNLVRGSLLKTAIEAPPGWRIVHRDASQIEARMTAWMARCDVLLDAFRERRDVYSEFARIIYQKPEGEISKLERFVGKTAILGLGYGCGYEKFRKMLFIGNGGVSVKVTTAEAGGIVRDYRSTYPEIPDLWGYASRLLLQVVKFTRSLDYTERRADAVFKHIPVRPDYDCFVLPNSMRICYPDLHQGKDKRLTYADAQFGKTPRDIYGSKAVENLSQALSRILITDVMLHVYKTTGYRAFLSTHDSLDFVVPASDAEAMDAELERQFAMVPSWGAGLPLASEGGWGRNLTAAEHGDNK